MNRTVRIAITLALVAVIVWAVGDLRQVGAYLAQADKRFIFLGLVVITLDRLLMSYKWGMLIPVDAPRLPLVRNCQIYCTAMVWGLVLPTTVGADAVRTYMSTRAGLPTNVVVASIVMERILGFIASLLVGMLSLVSLRFGGFLDEKFDPVFGIFVLTLAGAIGLFLGSLSTRGFEFFNRILPARIRNGAIGGALAKIHVNYSEYKGQRVKLYGFFALTILEQFVSVFFGWCIGLAFHFDVGFMFMLGIVPLATLVSRLPISIDGIGVVEGSLMALLTLAGVGAAQSLAFAVVARLVQIAAWLPWWLSYALVSGELRPPDAVSKTKEVR